MNILVLNGSPKDEYSITLQTVKYLKHLYPTQNFSILHIGQKTNHLKKIFLLQ